MALRRTKQMVTGNVVVAADNNATPSKKKRKVTVNSATERLRTRTKTEFSQIDKHEENLLADDSTSLPKNLRLRLNDVATKDETKSKSKKIKQETTTMAMRNNNAGEEIDRRAKEENARGKFAITRKTGTKKPVAAKLKTEVSSTKKQKSEIMDTGNFEENKTAPQKRNRRVNEFIEKNQQPVVEQPATKIARKRKPVEAVIKNGDTKASQEEFMTNKNSHGKRKKIEMDTNNASKIKSKERSTKNSTKSDIVKLSPKKSETKEHDVENIAVKKNDLKAKDAKNSKKGNAKKLFLPRVKPNSITEKIDSTQTEEVTIFDVNIKENNSNVVQIKKHKQNKKNTEKGNRTKNEKTEIKKRPKKVQELTNKNKTEMQ